MKVTKLKEAVEAFLRYLELERGYSQHTIRLYRNSLENFLAFVGDISLKRITKQKIHDYRQVLLKQQSSHKTRNLKLIPVRGLFAFLRARDVEAPASDIELFQNKNGHEKLELPPEEEIEAFLAPSEDEAGDLIVNLLVSTGLRLSELHQLKAGEVQETFNVVGKGAKERFVVCAPRIIESVRAFETKREIPKGKPLFGFSQRTIQKIVFERAKKHGLKLSVHTLRHIFATRFLARGADLRDVQEILGHSSIATTEKYTHVSNQRLLERYRTAFN